MWRAEEDLTLPAEPSSDLKITCSTDIGAKITKAFIIDTSVMAAIVVSPERAGRITSSGKAQISLFGAFTVIRMLNIVFWRLRGDWQETGQHYSQ